MLFIVFSDLCCATTPIMMVVPFAPGGPVDSVARIFQQGLSKELGQSVYIQYKPGGGGAIGSNFVADQKSNLVLMLHSSALIINPIVTNSNKSLSDEFKLIGYLGHHPFVLIANEKFVHKDLKTWNKLSKNDHISIGNGGVGTTSYIINKVFESKFPNINFIDVNYQKGASAMTNDILSGNLDLTISYVVLVKQLIDTGKINPMAVAHHTRLKFIPTTPTFKELGMPDIDLTNQYFLVANASASDSEVLRIRAATKRFIEDPTTKEIYKANGIEYNYQSKIILDTFIDEEYNRYKKLLKNIN